MTKEEFLKGVDTWGNHRTLLWYALESTKDSKQPILELGSGPSSTPFLRQYGRDEGRLFQTYETDQKWSITMNSKWVRNGWDSEKFWGEKFSVVLLDCAPGEYRKIALMKLRADIIVVHDSEPKGWNASDYKVRPLFRVFKHYKDHIPLEKGAPWTTALSNTIDVTKWVI